MRDSLRRLAACAVAVLSALMTAPAAADPAFLAITGSGPGYADVSLTAPLTVAYRDAVVLSDGRYAGFAVWQLGGARPKPFGGVLASRDLDAPARPVTVGAGSAHALLTPLPLGPASVTLAPGRYRFHLLADARAEIRLPLPPGTSGRTITAAKTSRQAYSGQQRTLGPATTSAALRAPLTGRATTRYHVFASASGVAEDVRVTACLTARDAPCSRAQLISESMGGGVSAWPATSGVGTRGALLRRATSDARAEVRTTTCAGCTLALVVLAYDL